MIDSQEIVLGMVHEALLSTTGRPMNSAASLCARLGLVNHPRLPEWGLGAKHHPPCMGAGGENPSLALLHELHDPLGGHGL